jgi:hypothetical protein
MFVYRWEDNIKMGFKELWEGVDYVSTVSYSYGDGIESLYPMKNEEFCE